jgi:hypothetical protein
MPFSDMLVSFLIPFMVTFVSQIGLEKLHDVQGKAARECYKT